MNPDRICLALDGRDVDRLRAISAETQDLVGTFKVGLTAFITAGPELIPELAARRPVFLDLKLHDIPHQVGNAMAAIADLDVTYASVHALGGPRMMAAAVEAAGGVKVLAVTLLTSLDLAEAREAGLETDGWPRKPVLALAERALEAGASGLVCSPQEIQALRQRFGPRDRGGPLLVVPGIRPAGAAPADQRRTTEPAAAVALGADLIVVGRPVIAAPDPAGALRALALEPV